MYKNTIPSIVSLVVLAMILFSCAPKKVNETVSSTENKSSEEADFLAKGFKKGVVIYDESAEKVCQYLVSVDMGTLEPMTLDPAFMKKDAKVWVIYTPQRRQGRCGQAMPVAIEDIRKREE